MAVEADYDLEQPNSRDAEYGVIGSMVLGDAAQRARIRSLVDRTSFYHADCAEVFAATADLLDAGKPVDAVLVREELIRRGSWSEIGGVEEVGRMLLSVPGPVASEHYAGIVRGKAVLRRLISLSNQVRGRCYAASMDADELAQMALKELGRIAVTGRSADYRRLDALIADVYDQLANGGVPTVPTQFRDLDRAVGGIQLGEMCVIAARPSMGKSTLIRQIGVRSALGGIPTGIISLEEGSFKIARNILAAECALENGRLRRGNLVKEEWDEIGLGIGRLGGIPLYVTDKARRMQDIKAVVTLWAAKHDVRLVIIDYLQRIRGVSGKDRYEQVTNTSLEVSDLFKDAGVAGIAVAQLNRGVESRDDKRPLMSDLRDSGQVEQDADAILFLHREDYYHLDDASYVPSHEAELIISKWRDSVRGITVRLKSELKYQRFQDMPEKTPFDGDV